MRLLPSLSGAIAASLLCSTVAFAQGTLFREDPFTDVAKNHANFEAVEYLRTHNIVKGYLDGTYKPTRRITRSEFTALLTNPFFLSGRSNDCLQANFSEKSTLVFFSDVARSSWYAQDVCEGIVHKLLNGYPDGTFRPQRNVNFAEAAKIAANLFSFDLREESGDARWFVPYVERLSELKAIPTSITHFDQLLTRGEMAEILFRLGTNNTTKASASFANLK